MVTSTDVKEFARRAGALRCGIAGISRFSGAPEGFHPRDIYANAKSVIVCACPMPGEGMFAQNPVPYTHMAYKMYEEMDRISVALVHFFEDNGVGAVLIPSDTPYIFWDDENKIGRGILSLKHAAVAAGLGIMGRSTIFIDKRYGNVVYLGAVLCDAELEEDPPETVLSCPDGCRLCADSCPGQAITDDGVNQRICREKSFYKTGRGWDLYACSSCRSICPLRKMEI